MPDIKITDNFGASADLGIRDGCPAAKAGWKHILAAGKELLGSINQPLDQAQLSTFMFGASADSPDLLSAGLPTLTLAANVNGKVKLVQAAAKTLFPDDGFTQAIPVTSDQVWVGVELDAAAKASASASVHGVGVAVAASGALNCTTYTLFTKAGPTPLPALKEALAAAIGEFCITTSAGDIRAQTPNTVNVTEVSGSIKTKVTLSLPYSVNALASANLPFKTTVSAKPSVTVQASGTLKLTGDFVFRCYKSTAEVVQLGIYKKQGIALTADFTAAAALEGDVGSTDVLNKLLNAALPGVDVSKAGLSGADAKALNGAIKDGLDRSIGAQLNAECSAAFTDEAAVVYELRLDQPEQTAAIDAALDQALGGDWSGMKDLAGKKIARQLRDITVQTDERTWTATLNLFGLYNATSVSDYVKTCTMKVDENGQLSLIDKADESRISARSSPTASDPQKLIKALMQDFVATASYALAGGKLGLTMTVMQTFTDYDRSMSRDRVRANVLLGTALGLIPAGALDSAVANTARFAHALFRCDVSYDNAALMNLFFSDTAALVPRGVADLETSGRQTMASFLRGQTDVMSKLRLSVLQNDAVWQSMSGGGNPSQWSSIAGFPDLHNDAGQLNVIYGDWMVIRWWAKAVTDAGRAVKAVMAAEAAAGPNPSNDPKFKQARQNLASVLGTMAKRSTEALTPEWGEAVMFTASGKHGKAMMDVAWNSTKMHYGPASLDG